MPPAVSTTHVGTVEPWDRAVSNAEVVAARMPPPTAAVTADGSDGSSIVFTEALCLVLFDTSSALVFLVSSSTFVSITSSTFVFVTRPRSCASIAIHYRKRRPYPIFVRTFSTDSRRAPRAGPAAGEPGTPALRACGLAAGPYAHPRPASSGPKTRRAPSPKTKRSLSRRRPTRLIHLDRRQHRHPERQLDHVPVRLLPRRPLQIVPSHPPIHPLRQRQRRIVQQLRRELDHRLPHTCLLPRPGRF